MDIRALRFHGVADLRLEEVTLPAPLPGQVVVGIEACGVCGSDLHFLDGSARTGVVPVTLGHEIAATVLDSASPAWHPGDPVVVVAGVPCGACPRCRAGRSNLCSSLQMTGIDFDGGWADAMVVSETALLRRPITLDVASAAVAADAGATALHALKRRGGITPGMSAAIIGVGGLGSFAVQMAKLLGATPVIAVDIKPAALERARAFGADDGILASPGVSIGREVKLLTEGGVDVATEFVGKAATVDAAIKSLAPGGTAVAVGVGMESLATLPPVLWATNEYELRGSFGCLPGDTEVVLGWLADGTIQPPPLHDVALEEAVAVIGAAARNPGATEGRLVIRPD